MENSIQKDLVLSINEYSYVLDETKGHVSCLVGPTKMSLSQSDKLVRFNPKTKSFEPCGYSEAKSLFTTAPENWYVILKNPVEGNKHPQTGTSNTLPDNIHIGEKINVRGPVSFALYPGQMAKVVKGHALRSNQYLLARVYEADAANSNQGEVIDSEGNKIAGTTTNYVNGQLLVIKGTEISFYIPPTGIEVIPVNNRGDYVREAVTLERLEYCILKDENGNKRYVHGPEVVFPEPTEQFVTSSKGGYIFKAIELSKISGVYVKVIAEYKDEDGTVHPVGEELFITGDQQMIYYPRPEHAIISYDNKIMHHAIAIPAGEGRYVMNRLTGEITTVKGPAMFLPDPRTQVIVKRKLTERECNLLYPGNTEALKYNVGLSEKSVEKSLRTAANMDNLTYYYSTSNAIDSNYSSLASLEAKASISRGTSYTKPRTITLDNKFDGVVSVDVWTGYAVNIVSKNGTRKVVCGPSTILLDYDQTLAELQMSTGKPKTTDHLLSTVFLRHEHNKISDIVNIETSDFVNASVKVSYCVNFDMSVKDKWFSVENYVKYLCDKERSLIKREAKKYTIEEFWANYSDIVRNVAIAAPKKDEDKITSADAKPWRGREFEENGMYVYDAEILSISVEDDIAELLNESQYDNIRQALELADIEREAQIAQRKFEAEMTQIKTKAEKEAAKRSLDTQEQLAKIADKAKINDGNYKIEEERREAELKLQEKLNAINDETVKRTETVENMKARIQKQKDELEKAKQEAYAEAIVKTLNAIQPGLIEALNAKSNTELMNGIGQAVSPYSMASGESIAEVVSTLLRGTPLEKSLSHILDKK